MYNVMLAQKKVQSISLFKETDPYAQKLGEKNSVKILFNSLVNLVKILFNSLVNFVHQTLS